MIDWKLWLSSTAGVLAFVQLIIWLNNRVFGPRRKLQLQNRSPLVGLKEYGFIASSNVYEEANAATIAKKSVGYVGQVNNYSVEIFFSYRTEWRIESPHFTIRIYFDLGDLNKVNLQQRLAKDLGLSKLFVIGKKAGLTFSYAERSWHFRYSLPSSQQLVIAVRELSKELEKLRLAPVDYDTVVSQIQKPPE